MKFAPCHALCFSALMLSAFSADVVFTVQPSATSAGGRTSIAFTLSLPNDVEVAVLDAKGAVARHLAAGVLGGNFAPPEPLQPGLAQKLEWEGTDDFGHAAQGGPFKVRVRAGSTFAFGRLIGADPYNFGEIDSIACDESSAAGAVNAVNAGGNLYVLGYGGEANQGHMVLRVFDAQGRYLRELLPFPADVEPGAMKDVARYDSEHKRFLPRNLKNLNPDFYDGNRSGSLHLFKASASSGVLLTDGARLCKLDPRGAVPEDKFAYLNFWPEKARNPNTGNGPVFLAASPDGKYLYLSGPWSSKTKYGHAYNASFPPGTVYRMKLDGGGTMQAFASIPVAHVEGQGGAWERATKFNAHFTVPHGPLHQVAIDAQGSVYVCDRERGRIAVFDASGRETGFVTVANPGLVAVHPATGALYVMQFDCVGYHLFQKVLLKFDKIGADAKPVAAFDFGPEGNWPSMALAAGKDKTIIWVAGVKGGLAALEDKGADFAALATDFKPNPERQQDWNRLAADFARDEIYCSNGTTRMWRYDGATGAGQLLKKDGKVFKANELAVGYDGLLYVRVSGEWDGSAAGYSGPFWRMDRDLNPAPFHETGTHVLSPYIYSRYGIGYAERGIGVGPDGKSYVSFMYRWVAYAVGGFGGDGKPLPGKYLKGEFPSEKESKKYPPGWDSAVIGPLPQANAGIRVDLKGNIYVGMLYWPKEILPPKGYEKDEAWKESVGSVVKFPPEGGRMSGKDDAQLAQALEGALHVYTGIAPFSKAGLGGNTCCVCRGPRFDIDRYGRLALPNALTGSVLYYDNAGNLIAEFGAYGNFDSQYVNPNNATGKAGKPALASPEIPLAWPSGAGLTEDHIYVNDTYERRAVRVDKGCALEATVPIP